MTEKQKKKSLFDRMREKNKDKIPAYAHSLEEAFDLMEKHPGHPVRMDSFDPEKYEFKSQREFCTTMYMAELGSKQDEEED